MVSTQPQITVLGSINMDLVVRCMDLPRPGETILAESSAEICGGKGANQAVAASRVGGKVRMIGRVGDDAFADVLLKNLMNEGVDCSSVRRTDDCASGLAVVAVESSGQNSIVVVPGANGRLTVDDVAQSRSQIESADVLLVQLEVPVPTILAAVEVAKQANVRVILDPAPAPSHLPEELLTVDVICPNESETAALTGRPVETLSELQAAAEALGESGQCRVAITLGERGTMLVESPGNLTHIPAVSIEAVDTTAAGDAFAGALAVYWAEGHPLPDAVRFANRAGAIAASRPGAQPGMPYRDEIEAWM